MADSIRAVPTTPDGRPVWKHAASARDEAAWAIDGLTLDLRRRELRREDFEQAMPAFTLIDRVFGNGKGRIDQETLARAFDRLAQVDPVAAARLDEELAYDQRMIAQASHGLVKTGIFGLVGCGTASAVAAGATVTLSLGWMALPAAIGAFFLAKHALAEPLVENRQKHLRTLHARVLEHVNAAFAAASLE